MKHPLKKISLLLTLCLGLNAFTAQAKDKLAADKKATHTATLANAAHVVQNAAKIAQETVKIMDDLKGPLQKTAQDLKDVTNVVKTDVSELKKNLDF